MSVAPSEPRTQINLLGAWVDPVSQAEALNIVSGWCRTRARQYVVTPNLDHCRLLRGNSEFADAYERAGLSMPDGWPLVAASQITKRPIRQRVTGSDFIVPLCRLLAANGFSIFLLGSTHEVLEAASKRLQELAPGLIVSGVCSPPFGFERDARQLGLIKEQITRLQPHALIVALGAPKQELWMASQVPDLPIGVAIGVGGTLDFLAGKQRRAPNIVQTMGMEWLWRALSDPRRLGKRYLAGIAYLPVLGLEHMSRHLIWRSGTVRQRSQAR